MPNAVAPDAANWGRDNRDNRDNRGAVLRMIGQPGEGKTRIGNRIGEPVANPYLYMAVQIHAGLYGNLEPPASDADHAIAQTFASVVAADQFATCP